MSFKQWLNLYNNAAFRETRVCLLSYLEQGNVKSVQKIDKSMLHSDIINNVLKRVYSL